MCCGESPRHTLPLTNRINVHACLHRLHNSCEKQKDVPPTVEDPAQCVILPESTEVRAAIHMRAAWARAPRAGSGTFAACGRSRVLREERSNSSLLRAASSARRC